jgi:DNA polymerase-3 subunit gamma/tau
MRDGLSLTDQVLALGDGRVTALGVREALGLVAEDEYLALLDVVAERRAGEVFPLVQRLVEQGIDLGQFLTGLSDMLRAQLAITLGAPQVDVSDGAAEALRARAGRLAAGDLLRMLSAVAELEAKFRKSTQQQVLLEAMLVRFALLDRTVDLESVLREMGGGSSGGGTGARAPAPPVRPQGPPPDRPGYRADGKGETPSSVPRVSEPSRPPRIATDSAPTNSTKAIGAGPGLAMEPEVADRRTPAAGSVAVRPVSTLDINSIVERWDDIMAALRRERPLVAAVFEHAIPSAVTSSGVLTLQLDGTANETVPAKDLFAALAPHIAGLSKVALKGAGAATNGAPSRMTAESVKSDTLASLRKKSPMIAAAIEALDLELI